jgi:pimeloyl-ACP methyl ester carboxylesterase
MSSYETSAATGPRALTIETSYLTLAALAWGDPGNRPVLALHGWLDNAASFEPMAPHLPGCRLVCLDLAGHGESGHRSAGIHYHFLDHVQDVIAAVDALGWDRFHILGHSLGASIALYVAAVIPERVSGLALIDGYGPLTAEPEAGPDQAAESISQMLAQPGRKRHVYPNLETAAAARARFGDLRLEDARLLVARNLEPRDGGYVWRSDAKLRTRSPFYFSESQVHVWLKRVHCPVRLLLARDGFLVKRPQMAARYECTPQLELREIDGGHHVHMERPVATAGALADCLPRTLEAAS